MRVCVCVKCTRVFAELISVNFIARTFCCAGPYQLPHIVNKYYRLTVFTGICEYFVITLVMDNLHLSVLLYVTIQTPLLEL